MMNNKLMAATVLALCTLGANPALAHETEKPRTAASCKWPMM